MVRRLPRLITFGIGETADNSVRFPRRSLIRSVYPNQAVRQLKAGRYLNLLSSPGSGR